MEVAPQANPPVARIMDYGKFKYERDIRQKEARKKQARVDVKEIKFRPKIDPHDYATKKGHVVRFLNAGARVKVTIMFRGREMAHTELGRKILDRLVEDLEDLAIVDSHAEAGRTQHGHGDRADEEARARGRTVRRTRPRSDARARTPQTAKAPDGSRRTTMKQKTHRAPPSGSGSRGPARCCTARRRATTC